jgi:hypothetical protein
VRLEESCCFKPRSSGEHDEPLICRQAPNVTELEPIARQVGEAWAGELVRAFRANERAIIGAWPGTMREARMRVLARLQRVVDLALLDELARVATVAARREWGHVSQPDPEP